MSSMADLELLFWGGGTDVKYAALVAAAAAGVTAADLMGLPALLDAKADVLALDAKQDAIAEQAAINNPSTPSALYSQSEAQSVRNRLVDVLDVLRTAGLIAT